MKAFAVLSLLVVANAVTFRGLGEIPDAASQQMAVISEYPADAAPVLLTLTMSSTYDSSASPLGLFNIGGSGTFTTNTSVVSLAITLSNGGDNVYVGATVSATLGNAFTLTGIAQPKFLNDGVYSISSLVFTCSNFKTYPATLPTALPTTTATKYTPPTLAAFNLISPQTLGCDNTGCTGYPNGTATLNPTSRTNLALQVLGSSPVAASSFWYTWAAGATAGVIDFNEDTAAPVSAFVGGWDSRGNLNSDLAQSPALTLLPINGALGLSGVIHEQSSFSTIVSAATFGAFQASVTSTVGSADVTAPTCTVATLTPTILATVDQAGQGTVTLTCSDENGGSGLWIRGAFGSVRTTTGVTQTVMLAAFTSGASDTFPVPPYVSGTVNLLGVFAIDNAGNAVLYGSCAGADGYSSLGCGGSSDASTVTLSLLSVAILAIFSLFA